MRTAFSINPFIKRIARIFFKYKAKVDIHCIDKIDNNYFGYSWENS